MIYLNSASQHLIGRRALHRIEPGRLDYRLRSFSILVIIVMQVSLVEVFKIACFATIDIIPGCLVVYISIDSKYYDGTNQVVNVIVTRKECTTNKRSAIFEHGCIVSPEVVPFAFLRKIEEYFILSLLKVWSRLKHLHVVLFCRIVTVWCWKSKDFGGCLVIDSRSYLERLALHQFAIHVFEKSLCVGGY